MKSYKANIFLHDGIVHYPCYVTDDSYIVGLHEFGKIDDITSPCFISKNDDFIKSQIEYLVTKSIELKY